MTHRAALPAHATWPQALAQAQAFQLPGCSREHGVPRSTRTACSTRFSSCRTGHHARTRRHHPDTGAGQGTALHDPNCSAKASLSPNPQRGSRAATPTPSPPAAPCAPSSKAQAPTVLPAEEASWSQRPSDHRDLPQEPPSSPAPAPPARGEGSALCPRLPSPETLTNMCTRGITKIIRNRALSSHVLSHGRRRKPAARCLHCLTHCKHPGMHRGRALPPRALREGNNAQFQLRCSELPKRLALVAAPTAPGDQDVPRRQTPPRQCADSRSRPSFAIPVSLRFAKLVKDRATMLTA